MKHIHARSLIALSTETLWDTLVGEFVLVFDDGQLETNAKETLYSSYVWEFHRMYPQTPVLMRHHVRAVLGKKRLGSETHLNLLGNVMWDVERTYRSDPTVNRDILAEMVYNISNHMYNELSYRLEEYVVSLDITDFIEVLAHPQVTHANEMVQPTEESIERTYQQITDVLRNDESLENNPISLAVRSNLVSIGQTLQCVSVRGFMTDTDSHQFRTPVMRGYAQGLRSFHDSLIESRAAAQSLMFSKSPLQQVEYFSRRLQLISQSVRNLHHGDCGSTKYFLWHVQDIEITDRQVTRVGDLKHLVGKHYMDDDGQLKTISQDDRHLIGRTIKMRSPLHCAHPDPYGVCSTCFGELSYSVPDNSNLGHMCCTSFTQKSTQSVLSTKHLLTSAAIEPVTVGPISMRYLKVGTDKSSYLLADRLLKSASVKLVIPTAKINGITDILSVDQVEDLDITRICQLEDIGFVIRDGNVADNVVIDVSVGRRLASLTYPMLNYIRSMGWEVDERGNYVFDMTQWDWNEPVLILPLKHINMSDHSAEIASMLESRVDNLKKRDTGEAPSAVLMDLYNLINLKLSVNIAVIEIVIYAAMIVSAEKEDYSLPKPWTTSSLGVMRLTMSYRSLSSAMAFEGHRDVIYSPISYNVVNRQDHPMDAIVMPEILK